MALSTLEIYTFCMVEFAAISSSQNSGVTLYSQWTVIEQCGVLKTFHSGDFFFSDLSTVEF